MYKASKQNGKESKQISSANVSIFLTKCTFIPDSDQFVEKKIIFFSLFSIFNRKFFSFNLKTL
jgi:hypothetical protein